MNKFIAFILMFLILFQASFSALALNKEKLMKLKPLPSERLTKMAEDYENSKIWPALGFGLLGLAVISANTEPPIDSYRLYNLSYGYMFLLLGGQIYFTPGMYETDRKVLAAMSTSGIEKEVNAYYLLKSYAEKNKISRKSAGVILTLYGLGWALLASASTDISQTNKDGVYTGAAIISGMGLLSCFTTTPIEKEVDQMDKELE